MHKFFAKTLFLGKKIIFLPECHSTNDYLMLRAKNNDLAEGTVVWTDHQTSGKGQRGNHWVSEEGKNLLCSVLIKPVWLSLTSQFTLTLYTAVAIREALYRATGLDFNIKWPNDIYHGKRKVAGILCESTVTGHFMESAVLGFGININQTHFLLPSAVSLSMITHETYDREEILENILITLEKWYHMLKAAQFDRLIDEYHKHFLGYKEICDFSTESGGFTGMIEGLGDAGQLKVKIINSDTSDISVGSIRSFGLKEIRMLV